MNALALAIGPGATAAGHTPAFGSGAWLILVICVIAVVVIFVGVLASGIWRRRRYPPEARSRRGPP